MEKDDAVARSARCVRRLILVLARFVLSLPVVTKFCLVLVLLPLGTDSILASLDLSPLPHSLFSVVTTT